MDLDDSTNGACRSSRSFSRPSPAKPDHVPVAYAIGLIKGGPNQAEGKKLGGLPGCRKEVQAKVRIIYGIPGRTGRVRWPGKNGETVKQAISRRQADSGGLEPGDGEEGCMDHALERM